VISQGDSVFVEKKQKKEYTGNAVAFRCK